MNTLDFLSLLKQRGVDLWLEGEELCFRAPKGAIDAALKEQLRSRKNDLIRVLSNFSKITERANDTISPAPSGEGLVMSYAQEGLWFMERISAGGLLYLVPLAFHVSGPVSRVIAQEAMRNVLHRHQALRTYFKSRGGHGVPVVDPLKKWDMQVLDLQGLPSRIRLHHARRLVSNFGRIPFDLEEPYLFRCLWVSLDDDEHVLAFCAHHIIFDGWSIGILVDEWTRFYQSLCDEQAPDIEKLSLRYTDFSRWERKKYGENGLDQQLEWWKAQLTDAQPTLLQGDRPRPSSITYNGANVHFMLPETILKGIEGFAAEEKTGLFTVLTAAYFGLIYRLLGQVDLSIGAALSCRDKPELQGLIGLFVNLITLRVAVHNKLTFRELVGRTRKIALESMRRGNVPFEKVVKEVANDHEDGLHPLFNIQVVMANGLLGQYVPKNISITPFHWGSGVVARKDITLLFGESDGCLMVDVEYNTDIYDGTTMMRMIRIFSNLLTDSLENPGKPLTSLSLLDQRQIKKLNQWNENLTEYAREQTVHRIFERQCRRTPNATALLDAGVTVTYGELNARSNRMASLLLKKGVRTGDSIGFMLQQGTPRIAIMLAALKVGMTFVPLDARYPQDRLGFMIEDTGMKLLLTERAFVGVLPEDLGPRLIVLERERGGLDAEGADNHSSIKSHPLAPAYVMYTSGSTGRPKGVVIPHRGIIRLVKQNRFIELSKDDVFIQSASVSFDASTFEIWGALLNGCQLVLMASHAIDELPLIVQRHKVTVLWLTAQLFHLMVDRHLASFGALRWLLAGGEALSPDHVRRFMERYPSVQLINGYGPTENTTFTACARLQDVGLTAYSAPIGEPISNTSVYLLDAFFNLVPVGYAGQLYTGGDGLAQGYLNRPALTAQAFIPNPFASTPGERLYLTGDKVRIRSRDDHDTQLILEFDGRMDRQIKLRGFRIEPGEIERVLCQLPEIQQAYVYLGQDTKRGPFLGAYASIGKAQQANSGAIRRLCLEFMGEQLPQFQIPTALNLISEFSLNTNGKLDLKSLPKPTFLDEVDEGAIQAPRTPTEELLASIWSGLLGEERISRNHNFFEMGGHSLLANRLMGQVCETFAVDLPLRLVFDLPVLHELAEGIDGAMRDGSRLVQASIPQLPRNKEDDQAGYEFKLSFAQERLWFLDRLEPGSAMYSVPVAVRMSGTLFKDTLRACFNEVIRRHETLRTFFVLKDGTPKQIVLPELEIPFSVVDLRDYPVDSREAECMTRMTETAQIPFSLEEGPLLRLVLYRLKHDCHIMLMNMHHIVSDGWSLKILFNEVAQLYGAYARGQSSPLEPLPIQYVDYAAWQREWFAGDVREAQLAYWREQLKDAANVLDLPLDYPRPKVQTFRGAGERFFYTKELTTQFQTACRENAVTPFMMCLAAYAVLLTRYSGQSDLCIGSPVANRQHQQVQNLIGFFLNTLVFRLDLRQVQTYHDLIALARRTALDAYAHQELPFEQLVSDLQIERDMSRSPLFQAALSWDTETTDTEVSLPGLLLKHQGIDYRIAKFDLSLGLGYYQGKLFGSFGYNVDLFRASTVQRMSAHFESILRFLITKPDLVICDASILSQSEMTMLLETVNNTEVRFQPFGAHSLLETMAQSNGSRLACVANHSSLNYGQLNERANQLAHDLLERGTGVGKMVAICCDPTVDMVIAQVAVLKTGAAFVPLDPNYPGERLRYMLHDCGAEIALSQNHLLHVVGDFEGTLLVLDEVSQVAMREEFPVTNPAWAFSPEMAAYMIYTSGSTGQPKGVVVPHKGLTNLVGWHQRAFAITAEDRATKIAHVGFDASVWEIWPYLCSGASLHMAETSLLRKPGELLRWLLESRISIAFLPTPVVELMIHLEWPRHCALRYLLTGGDQLHHFPKDHLPFKLVNNYGPTENTVVSTSCQVIAPLASERMPAIGLPISNVQIFVLDQNMRPTLPGIPGEVFIGGDSLARGYHGRRKLTAWAFVPNPFSDRSGSRLYKTGDLARYLLDGEGCIANMEFLGRIGNQVKLRGFRIELGEVEHHLCAFEGVTDAVVVVAELDNGEKKLVGYVQVPNTEEDRAHGVDINDLREYMAERLPYYMIPSVFVVVERFPMTPNGKVDRRVMASARALSPALKQDYAAPTGKLEKQLSKIWAEVLGVEKVGTQANFFDLGGHSLLLARVQSKMEEALQLKADMVELFQYPTIEALVKHLVRQKGDLKGARSELHQAGLPKRLQLIEEESIAIVGFSGAFPGAPDPDSLWQMILEGREGIVPIDPEQLERVGVPKSLQDHPDFVARAATLDDIDTFDAAFFDITPAEAERMDPQHRLFLEHAWTALEHAGYDPSTTRADIGLFAGCGTNGYLFNNLLPHRDLDTAVPLLQGLIGNEGGFMPTRVSYKLNLKGPSINVQTACSTSLVATNLACQSLLVGESDIAMAGGVNIQVPHGSGYTYSEGMPLSKDGSCRPFDADASGTVPGSGVGLVVLKRHSDAVRDGDTIYALIKGAAINNDGQDKSGYSAPSVGGQVNVIKEALAFAKISSESIGYIETHGTGTRLGDPIELKALRTAFGKTKGRHALGSIKAQIGHLDAAAGVAGLIKAIQVLRNRTIPAQINFNKLNPEIDLGKAFYVPQESCDFEPFEDQPRRAAVSSFGIGGTNAHIILEETTQAPSKSNTVMPILLLLSARCPKALETKTVKLRRFLRKKTPNLVDTAYTLAIGRKRFEYRRFLLCSDLEDAVDGLDEPDRLHTFNDQRRQSALVFAFPGQGSQYVQMGRLLYKDDPSFKTDIDRCADIVARLNRNGDVDQIDLRELLYPSEVPEAEGNQRLTHTQATQPAVFAVSWALARWWIRRGIRPSALIGHSLGEYVAATVAEVFSLEDALALVHNRARLMGQLEKGSMLAVPVSPEDLYPLLGQELAIAAINAPQRSVVSGSEEDVLALIEVLSEKGIAYQRIPTNLAFHSKVVESIAEQFEQLVRTTPRKQPQIPIISNVHGDLFSEEDLNDPTYWVRHLRGTVQFQKGVETLLNRGERCFLEVGPGQALSSFLGRISRGKTLQILTCFPRKATPSSEVDHLHKQLGKLWQLGFSIDWMAHFGSGRRIALPTYPFQRASFWIDPPVLQAKTSNRSASSQDIRGILNALQALNVLKVPAANISLKELEQSLKKQHSEKALIPAQNQEEDNHSPVIVQLIEIWQKILGVKDITPQSNFISLGGDSLAAAQLHARILQSFQVHLSISVLFDAPNLEALAKEIEGRVHDDSQTQNNTEAPALDLENAIKIPFPPPAVRGRLTIPIEFTEELARLSFAQERLWFFEKLDPQTACYNLPNAILLEGPLNLHALNRTICEITARHDALRTVVKEVDGFAYADFLEPQRFKPTVIDLSSIPHPDGRPLKDVLRREAHRAFDPAQGLWRSLIIRLNAQSHVLMIHPHHLVFDGWSLKILLQELAHLYCCLVLGVESALPDLHIQYADFASWQRRRPDDVLWRARLDRAVEKLRGTPPRITLPEDLPPRGTESYRGRALRMCVTGKLVQDIEALCMERGVTPYMVLLSAFSLLLCRHSKQTEVNIGSPVAARTLAEIEGLIGCFANTVVFNIAPERFTTFEHLLTHVRQAVLEGVSDSDIPFELIVERLQPQRNTTEPPVFQVLFSTENLGQERNSFQDLLPGLRSSFHDTGLQVSSFHLDLAVLQYTDGMDLRLIYSCDRFEASTVQGFLRHYLHLLEELLSHTNRPLDQISMITDEERKLLLERWQRDWNEPEPFIPSHERFSWRAEIQPQAIAIEADGQTFTYKYINGIANQLAFVLRHHGVVPEQRVAVWTDRGHWPVVIALAVLKAGGTWLPIDPAAPKKHVNYILNVSDAHLVVVNREDRNLTKQDRLVILEDLVDTAKPYSRQDPPWRVQPAQSAYQIFTSGSTGTPKGVIISHSSMVNHNLEIGGYFGLEQGDRVLHFATVGFDLSIEEMMPTILSGATLVRIPHIRARQMYDFTALVSEKFISVLSLPTAFWHEWTPMLAAGKLTLPQCVRIVIIGTEAADLACLESWRSFAPQVRFVNAYGTTETTITSSVYEPRLAGIPGPGPVPIGGSIASSSLYVVDNQMELAGIGVVGELLIGGPGLARGYMNQPALTAQAFVPDPFSGRVGSRLYRSGDLSLFMPEGTLLFKGRRDRQLKIQGYRVEPAAIEHRLKRLPGIVDAVVIVNAMPNGATRLIAYLAGGDEGAPEIDFIKERIDERLPAYMIPHQIIGLSHLPRTLNGKVDLDALPEPGESRHTQQPANGQVEMLLCQLWQELLGFEANSSSHFFENGGHSLLAIRLLSSIHKIFDINVPVKALFENATPRSLARYLRSIFRSNQPKLPRMTSAPTQNDYPLSLAQERLYFLDRMWPDYVAYLIPVSLNIRGCLSPSCLSRAIDDLVARHGSLRTRFLERDGQPRQALLAPGRGHLHTIDLSRLDPVTREIEIDDFGRELVSRPIPISEGHAFRAVLVRRHDHDHVLFFVVHHIIADGWSLDALFRDLHDFYYQEVTGEDRFKAQPRWRYVDYAVWQRKFISEGIYSEKLAWWQAQLQGAPTEIKLPMIGTRDARRVRRSALHRFSMDPTYDLDQILKDHEITSFMYTLAAFMALLSSYARQERCIVGTPIAGREYQGLDDVVGLFVNTVPLHTLYRGTKTVSQWLAEIRQHTLLAFSNCDVPLEKIVETLNAPRDVSRPPLFNILFVFEEFEEKAPGLPGTKVSIRSLKPGAPQFDLSFSVVKIQDKMKGAIQYDPDLLSASLVEGLANHMTIFMEGMARGGDQLLGRVSLLKDDVRRQLLERWHCRTTCNHNQLSELLLSACVRYPNELAVCHLDQQLTYADFLDACLVLAGRLRERGVGPGDVVAVCLPRSVDQIVALWGIMFAGAAFLPMDPNAPQKRAVYQLRDAHVRFGITNDSGVALFGLQQIVSLAMSYEGAARLRPDQVICNQDLPAYVMYTSGSTGNSKGVMMGRHSLIHFLKGLEELVYPGSVRMRLSMNAPLYFDACVQQWTRLLYGDTVCIVPETVRKDPAMMLRWLDNEGIQVLDTTPGYLQLLLDEGLFARQHPSLVKLLIGGEAIHAKMWKRLSAVRYLHAFNVYGPTEACVEVTCARLQGDTPNMGLPMRGVRAYVFNEQMDLLPPGVPGELFIGGPNLAMGYMGKAALTAVRFVPDPFTKERPGARLYRTGDLVRIIETQDGQALNFVRRLGGMAKLNGQRLELAEITQALLKIDGVEQAYVTLAGEGESTHLVAYIKVDTEQQGMQVPMLRRALSQRLPDYMLPSVFVPIERWPLLPNGKLDHHELTRNTYTPSDENDGHVRTRTERLVLDVWEDLLKRGVLGVEDNLLQYGAHSLLMIRANGRLSEQVGLDLPLVSFFRYTTVREQARYIELLDWLSQMASPQITIPDDQEELVL